MTAVKWLKVSGISVSTLACLYAQGVLRQSLLKMGTTWWCTRGGERTLNPHFLEVFRRWAVMRICKSFLSCMYVKGTLNRVTNSIMHCQCNWSLSAHLWRKEGMQRMLFIADTLEGDTHFQHHFSGDCCITGHLNSTDHGHNKLIRPALDVRCSH